MRGSASVGQIRLCVQVCATYTQVAASVYQLGIQSKDADDHG